MALTLVFGLAGCASTIDLPVITPDAGNLRLTGKFVWFDLFTSDMNEAGRFYDYVFNWSLERTDADSPRVKTILHQGRRIGNIFLRESGHDASEWLSCMSVPDVDRAFARAVETGGTSEVKPADRPFRGRMAVVRDPGMAVVALLTSSVGDPRDLPLGDGYWMGAELWARDMNESLAFYSGLAGYKTAVLQVQDAGQYVLFIGNGRPRGGMISIPVEGVAPRWIPQVAVLDIEATLAKVEAHGGKVLIPPRPRDKPGRVAVFADPFGAILGLREFTPPEN
ncbi:VOC family protein [Pseudodesulfovibrio sp. S3-i]|nr:VOC family protein [Pseudodesulfovibrio sp. S3-i]